MAHSLKITSWKFLSAVDAGAQGEISNVALVKRKPTGDEYTVTCKVGKIDEALGVVFGYAFASHIDGKPHVDLQDDAIVGGDELIKVALGFVEAGAASDVMHDENPDGFVPFVMPLNDETKKAFKLSGNVEGIAIGMKPSDATFKRFVSGELQGFSIGGTGIRTPIAADKRAPSTKIAKASLYTDEVEGHQHKICVYEDGSFWVDYATMGGADASHSHGIIRGDDGSLVILADSGHSHMLAEGQPSLVIVAADAIVVVAQSAPSSKSTTAFAVSTVNTNRTPPVEKNTMKTDAEKLADLQKRHDRLAGMSGIHKVLFDTLKGDDAESFLAKSDTERQAQVDLAEKANEVVYTSKSTGEVWRKSDDFRLVAQAKRHDEMTVELAKRDLEIEKATFEKRAELDLGSFAKSLDARTLIVRAILKSGAEKALIDEAFEALKGANAAMKLLEKGNGVGAENVVGGTTIPTGDTDSAMAELEKGLNAFCKTEGITKNLWTEGLAKFVKTPAGEALKAAVDGTIAA